MDTNDIAIMFCIFSKYNYTDVGCVIRIERLFVLLYLLLCYKPCNTINLLILMITMAYSTHHIIQMPIQSYVHGI